MRLLKRFVADYPWQSLLALLALLLAGLMEGLSLTTLLPVLTTALDGTGAEAGGTAPSGTSAVVTDALDTLGVDPTLGVLLAVVVLGMALKGALVLLANKQVGYTVAHVATDLRLSLLRAVLATRWEHYLRQRVGEVANAVATEAYRASQAYLHAANLTALLVQSLVYVAVALVLSWQATVAALGAAAVLVLVLGWLVRMARRAGARQTRLLKSLLARLTDTLGAVKPLKAMAREGLVGPLLEAETHSLNHALEREVFSRAALRGLQEPMLTAVVAAGLYAAVTWWSLPVATLLVLVFLLARLLAQLGKVQREYQKMVSGESAYWSLDELARRARSEREPPGGGLAPPSLRQSITLEHVAFAYTGEPVLRDVSLSVPARAFTTLVGPSGAGKTTVVDLITGLLRPHAGAITVDGVPLERLDLRRWRGLIGYVPQDTLLLHDSLLNNVTLGDPDLGEDDAQEALVAAGAWDFVATLPQGLHTPVGERGATLSGGQRQRIAVARALVHGPSLLILDEATSALDAATQAALIETLEGLRGRLTLLAISHHPAMVEAADRVYRIEGGVAALEREAQVAAAL